MLKGDFSFANSWFKDNKEKAFIQWIVIGNEKWIFEEIMLRYVRNGCHHWPQHQYKNRIFMFRGCLARYRRPWAWSIYTDIHYNWIIWAMHYKKRLDKSRIKVMGNGQVVLLQQPQARRWHSPSDYWLFRRMQYDLAGHWFIQKTKNCCGKM